MEHTLQVELDFDWSSANYRKREPETLVKVFGSSLTYDLDDCKPMGGMYAANRETFYMEVLVSDVVFERFSKDYESFIFDYFGHIVLSDYAVKNLRVQDSDVVKERLEKFLADFSFDPEN